MLLSKELGNDSCILIKYSLLCRYFKLQFIPTHSALLCFSPFFPLTVVTTCYLKNILLLYATSYLYITVCRKQMFSFLSNLTKLKQNKSGFFNTDLKKLFSISATSDPALTLFSLFLRNYISRVMKCN